MTIQLGEREREQVSNEYKLVFHTCLVTGLLLIIFRISVRINKKEIHHMMWIPMGAF